MDATAGRKKVVCLHQAIFKKRIKPTIWPLGTLASTFFHKDFHYLKTLYFLLFKKSHNT